ncbi:hypothetical protein GV828_01860 [Flavobacterium sp. NST-5]|uniref:Transglutaminase-like domain-containing protein n=1 Tax=Flavobacterium ichthyis TaxID=2698827 RepID=A0ABW9Z525_9FLAO|nr:transglutaminase domain-containing protein [Flavobacterium ichthyis]NBL63940.1 hypothetical protein [Flavobacterium ichthyis]
MRRKMMRFLLLFIWVSFPMLAQDFVSVDQKISRYPKRFSSPEELAQKINQDFTDENQKARAVFSWIAFNIDYDVKAYFANSHQQPIKFSYKTQAERTAKLEEIRQKKIMAAFKSQKTLCHGYSLLFQEICRLVGLQAEVVTGKTKTSQHELGKYPAHSSHAWNVVKTNNKWKLIDVTWGAGTVNESKRLFVKRFNPGYFFSEPNVFISNHFPDDSQWVLANLTQEDFATSPLFFSEYFKSNIRFVGNNLGVISTQQPGTLSLQINNVQTTDVIDFVLNQNKTAQKYQHKINGNQSDFLIAVADNFNGYLTVFVNGKAFSAHKIIPRRRG